MPLRRPSRNTTDRSARTALLLLVIAGVAFADQNAARQKVATLYPARHFKEAYELIRPLCLDPTSTSAVSDASMALHCLSFLYRFPEMDDFREAAVRVHSNDWQLLARIASSYVEDIHYGTIVAGEFIRDNGRGNGQAANVASRDRVRAMQLLCQALPFVPRTNGGERAGAFFMQFADTVTTDRGHRNAWRLQELTPLDKLPDWEPGRGHEGRPSDAFAPVATNGDPILYRVPASFETARNDGERWRWLLAQAAATDTNRAARVFLAWAKFLREQFGFETMGPYNWFHDRHEAVTGTTVLFAVETLRDDETIAALASGPKRFTLPDDFNYIAIYKEVASRKGPSAEYAIHELAQEFERRRQFAKAAEWWRRSIAEYGDGKRKPKQQRLDHIVGNWGRFESTVSGAAGANATVGFRFRNATKASFEARRIALARLLFDIRSRLRGRDASMCSRPDIEQYVAGKAQTEYLLGVEREWTMDLDPPTNHADSVVEVDTGLSKAGAYLLTARVAGGNESRIILWLDDTVIVSKQLDNERTAVFVLDARTGAPLHNQEVILFSYSGNDPFDPAGKDNASQSTRRTDAKGMIIVPGNRPAPNVLDLSCWLVSANGDNGRVAFVGWDRIWNLDYRTPDGARSFLVTDRPVYRPGHEVKFKIWADKPRYGKERLASAFAGLPLSVQISDPKNEKVWEGTTEADEYGGVAGEWTAPTNATLGVYSVTCTNLGVAGVFRIEEYRRPEFEVFVQTPDPPPLLGDRLAVKATAKYYFGSPLSAGTARYEIRRTAYSRNWYPPDDWDWLYGAGYWWFGGDCSWHPGWNRWRPHCGPRHGPFAQEGELVARGETAVGPDGTMEFFVETAEARSLFGNTDHAYDVSVEVADASRRVVKGGGKTILARKPFEVYVWPDRGHYSTGDLVRVELAARAMDGTPMKVAGSLALHRVLTADGRIREEPGTSVPVRTDDHGTTARDFTVAQPGQYRAVCTLSDRAGRTVEGGHVLTVLARDADADTLSFQPIEIIPDRRLYSPGECVHLRIGTAVPGSTVLLFVRSATNVPPQATVVSLKGKSVTIPIPVTPDDVPNMFVEAVTVRDGKTHEARRLIAIPPEKRIIEVTLRPGRDEYAPGDEAEIVVNTRAPAGDPCTASVALAVYDRSLEYISGGPNASDIRQVFWKWLWPDNPWVWKSTGRSFHNIVPPRAREMRDIEELGPFWRNLAITDTDNSSRGPGGVFLGVGGIPDPFGQRVCEVAAGLSPGAGGDAAGGDPFIGRIFDTLPAHQARVASLAPASPGQRPKLGQSPANPVDDAFARQEPDFAAWARAAAAPTLRKNFADTAFWTATLHTDSNGQGRVRFALPHNLTTWLVRAWAVGRGVRVGQAEARFTARKDIVARLETPRFLVEKDEASLSAIVHNHLDSAKKVAVSIELGGDCLALRDSAASNQWVTVNSSCDQRVDWRVRAVREGEAVARARALSDKCSDAVEVRLPVRVHGFAKTFSFSGSIRPNASNAVIELEIPAERRVEQSRLVVRYSPTLAGAIVDAIPYLIGYPYGCTEQTLNRFVPAVIARKTLRDMGVDLDAIRAKRTNLNAQEMNAVTNRLADRGTESDPVFDDRALDKVVKAGVAALARMQCVNGGWGWFSGDGEKSDPHTTALVVRGLQIAAEHDVRLPPGMLEQGRNWLAEYQANQLRLLRSRISGAPGHVNRKEHADELDALVNFVLAEGGRANEQMSRFLYRDRARLSLYGQVLLALALDRAKLRVEFATVVRNIEQFLVEDAENQTAHLRFDNKACWWNWFGDENEANACYLKLLARSDPKSAKTAAVAKYLINNRPNSGHWRSTRDTAFCIEALSDFIRAAGEAKPDMTVEILFDGKLRKTVRIGPGNIFTFDSSLVLTGAELPAGSRKLEVQRHGRGPVYFNAYLTHFSVEDPIAKAGLEVRVERRFFRLVADNRSVTVPGASGQPVKQNIGGFEREPLANLAQVKSGDIVEVELVTESKNDYEYLVIEDRKPAGFEPEETTSGYNGNAMDAYVEFRDDRVCFFLRNLARGTHSVSYRVRAESPGTYSALPARIYGMYAPELVGNSDEIKLKIED